VIGVTPGHWGYQHISFSFEDMYLLTLNDIISNAVGLSIVWIVHSLDPKRNKDPKDRWQVRALDVQFDGANKLIEQNLNM